MEVSAWLRDLGLERYETAFRDSEISLAVLPELTDADLRELGIPLGPRKLILKVGCELSERRSRRSITGRGCIGRGGPAV